MRHEDFAEFRKSGDFEINPQSPLARGARLLGLGRGRKSLTFRDESPYCNHGVLTNMEPATDWVWEPTLGRWVTDHNGTNDYIALGTALSLKPTGAMTISAWFRGVGSIGGYNVFSCMGSSGNRGYGFGALGTTVYAGVPVDATTLFEASGAGHSAVIWTHYSMVFVPSVGLYIYRNGRQVAANTTSPPAALYQNTLGVCIGTRQANDTDEFTGQIGESSLHARALSVAEIAGLADRSNVDLSVGGVPLILPVWRRIFKAAGAGTPYTRTIGESVGLTDSCSRLAGFGRSFSESLGLSDTSARPAGFSRPVADALGLLDVSARVAAMERAVADSLGLSDTPARLADFIQAVGDDLGLTDSLIVLRTLEQLIADAVNLSDARTQVVNFLRTIADDEGLADSIARVGALVRAVTDTEGLTDSVTALRTLEQLIADAIGLTDARSQVADFLRTMADSEALSDSLVGVGAFARDRDDAEGLTDAASYVFSGRAARRPHGRFELENYG